MARRRNRLPPASPPPHCWGTWPRGGKARNQVLHRYRGTKVVLASNTFTGIGYLAVLPWYHYITLKMRDSLFVVVQVTQGIATSNHKWTKKHNRRCNGFSLKLPYVWIWVWIISMLINYQLASTDIFCLPLTAPLPCRDVLQKSTWFIKTSKPLLTVLWFSIQSCQRAQSWKSWVLCQQNQHVYTAAYHPPLATRTITHRLAIEYGKLLIPGAYWKKIKILRGKMFDVVIKNQKSFWHYQCHFQEISQIL